jgi:hypothetical protein
MITSPGLLSRITGPSVVAVQIKKSGFFCLKKHGPRFLVVTRESRAARLEKLFLRLLVLPLLTSPTESLRTRKPSGKDSMLPIRRSTLLLALFLLSIVIKIVSRFLRVASLTLMPIP